jgi:hypothetical protein
VLIDGIDTAQLGCWLVVVLPDLFRRSAFGRSCRLGCTVVKTHADVRDTHVGGSRKWLLDVVFFGVIWYLGDRVAQIG